jgi:hypothetical protein
MVKESKEKSDNHDILLPEVASDEEKKKEVYCML